MLAVINFISVFIYGVLIMGFFLNIKMNKKNMLYMAGYVIVGGYIQYILTYFFGSELVEKLYPLVIHMPLFVFFCTVFKKRINMTLFVLVTSYIFTIPRKWIGELVASFFDNDPYIALTAKISASIFLLILIYKYLRPFMNRIVEYTNARIILLAMVPIITYLVSYATTVYTEALYHSSMLVVALFIIGINFFYYVFLIAYFIQVDKSFVSQTEQTILRLQMETTIKQIEDYKIAQMQAVIYRHDLRHHLHFLSNSIAENHIEEALDYIKRINKDAGATRIKNYCENISVNLILSAYAAKAEQKNIELSIFAIVPKESDVEFIDVCMILSNGIDNAIQACTELKKSDRKIKVSCKFENKKIRIEICNNFEGKIAYSEDIPISEDENHGIGVKSIVATVKKYHGLYSFSDENGIFTMRVII